MERLSSFELHRELKVIQAEGSKRTFDLWGKVRQIRSINSVIMMKRDEARKQLETYVNKLLQCLQEFRTSMVTSMDKVLQKKQDELTLLKKRYEDDVETLVMLCTEIETMVEFGKDLKHPSDRSKAQSLLEALMAFLSREVKDCSTKNLCNFDVKTTLQLDEITPTIFGRMSSDASFPNTGDASQTGFQKSGEVTIKVENEQVCVKKETSETGSKEKGTQTLTMCVDQGLQTEDLQRFNTAQSIAYSPGRPMYPAIPDAQNISPVHLLNNPSQIPLLSPILVYDPCLMGGSSPLGVNCNTYIPLLQEGQQMHFPTNMQNPSAPQSDYVTSNQNTNAVTKGSEEYKGVQGTRCPPGFSVSDASPGRNINLDQGNSNNSNSSLCETESCPSSTEKSRTGREINIKGQALDDYLKAQYDRSSVYIPPPASDFVKDLKKQFDGASSHVERKPLRRPFSHPADSTQEMYCHSTPIKNRQLANGEMEGSGAQTSGTKDGGRRTKISDQFDKTDENDNLLACRQDTDSHTEYTGTKDITDFVEIPSLDTESRMTLSDHVKQNHPPSVQEKNRQTLKAQTNWCKGYLSQRLRSADRSNARASNVDVKENTEKQDSEVTNEKELDGNVKSDTGYMLDSDMTKTLSSETNAGTKDPSDSNRLVIQKDDSGISISDKSKCEQSIQSEKEEETRNLSNQEKGDTSEEKQICTDDGISDVEDPASNSGKEAVPQPITTSGIGATQECQAAGDNESNPGQDSETLQEPDSSKNTKATSVPERKSTIQNQTHNLNKAVKQFLGEPERKPRTSRRIGALQEHWLKTCRGSGSFVDMEAKFVFKLSGNFHFPIGVATNSEKQLIVADTGNHVMKMFDESGHLICEFGTDLPVPLMRPSAIVVNDRDNIFVKDDICIRVFDKKGQFVKDLGMATFKRGFGLAMTPAKNLIVLDTHYSNPFLVHLSQDGKDVFHFLYTPLVNAHPQSKCRFLGVSDNNVIVSDLGISQVYITTLEGVYLTRFGTYGSGLMQFCEPSGVSVDIYGNFVIGDSKNNRIQIYRYDGSFTGMLNVDEPIVRPSGLHLTPDNKLLVVNFLEHCVKVYQL